ncbi:MAG: imidazole glycerol phosphate synthase cyclase subunit, partial [Chitinispirillales bacterium]|nr:imidazole glycerol phosphate synthase cyclase subunit [Chitinispirillales bacterium]
MTPDTIKIMPCLDIRNGRVVKGVQFVDIRDAGDPVECAAAYCKAGADEIAMLDITATVENRPIMIDIVKNVARAAAIPLSVGGGIYDDASAEAVLEAGAGKVSISSAAFRKPEIIDTMVKKFGSKKVIVAVDVAVNGSMPSGYEVFIDGGATATGHDAIEWVKRIDGYGAGTVLPTNKTTDGVRGGYALELIKMVRQSVSADVDVVASGGAGTLEHFKEAAEAGASVLLAASVFHF